MTRSLTYTLATAATLFVAAVAVGPVGAQTVRVVQASGFATVSVAGLGHTSTVTSESRLPILTRDIALDRAATGHLHLRASGQMSAIREIEIDVPAPRVGVRYPLGASDGATVRLRMQQGGQLTAETGRGHVMITALDNRRVEGTYEGSFNRGQMPFVVRGRFEAMLPRAGAVASPSPSTPSGGATGGTTPPRQ
jgi:hypothetical protein